MLKNFAGFEYYISKTNLKILIVFILDIIIFYFFYIKFYKKIENKDKMTVIFFVTVAGYLFYLIIYQPILYYFSDPGFAGITFYPLLLLVIVVFAAAFVILTVFYFIIPVSLKMFFTRFLLSLFLCTLVYSLFLKLKTGNLDFFIFQFENIVLKMPLKQYLLDPVIIVTLWYVSKQLLVKYKNIIITVFITGSFLLFINLIMQYNKIDSDSNIDKISAEDIVAEISKAAFESHKFSKTGTNIVFFIADMFNGNYIGRLIEKNPEYKEKLSGFTWYPDCLSVSAATISSLPAMLAGYDYIPLKLINNDKTGREELKEAAKYFFPKVKAAGYKVTVTNPHIFFKEETGDDVYLEQSSRFINYWKKENGFSLRKDNSGIASLLILVSIFNSSPNNLKYSIYDDSGWLGLRNKEYIKAAREYAIKELAYINLLPEISSIDGREKVFFYIHNRLTHFPYGIDESGNVITGKNKNYSINKKQDIRDTGKDSKDLAYYSAKKTIDILLNWFDWMKANGVYDNTLIMIVSDHGNLSNDSDLNIKNVPSSHFSRSNSLLLIKDFNAAGLLNIDKSYISSADILSILESESDISFEGTKDPRLIKEKRKRIYSYFLGNTQQFTEQKTIKIKHYSVTGSIFDSNSWEEIK